MVCREAWSASEFQPCRRGEQPDDALQHPLRRAAKTHHPARVRHDIAISAADGVHVPATGYRLSSSGCAANAADPAV